MFWIIIVSSFYVKKSFMLQNTTREDLNIFIKKRNLTIKLLKQN